MPEIPKKYIEPDQYEVNQSVLNKSRSDKFIMVLTLPQALRNLKSDIRSNTKLDFDTLQFTIKGSPVPDIIVPAKPIPYAGQEIKISSHSRQAYDSVFVDFTIDNLYRNWWSIYQWLDLLNDEKHSYYNENGFAKENPWEALKDYTATFTIYGLDEYNNRVIQFDYEGAFPLSLGSPKYDDTTANEIQSKFEFAFSFFKATLI
jgi:hypothetical protein